MTDRISDGRNEDLALEAFASQDFIDLLKRREKKKHGNLTFGDRRWLAKIALRYEGRKAFVGELSRRMRVSGAGEIQEKTFYKSLDRDKDETPGEWHDLIVAMARDVAIRPYKLPAGGHSSGDGEEPLPAYDPVRYAPIDLDEFDNRRFEGRNAPYAFVRRVLGLPRMLADPGPIGSLFDTETPERRRLLDDVAAFLDDTAEAYRPCMVIHSSAFPSGLSALGRTLAAGHVERRGHQRTPVRLVCLQALAAKEGGASLAAILHELLWFYFPTPEPVPSLNSEQDVRQAITRLRKVMARHPATFIFDGVTDYAGSLRDLQAVMADDPFAPLIRSLLLPYPGTVDRLSDPKVIGKSRFIILSDGPLKWLDPYCHSRRPLLQPTTAKARTFILGDQLYAHPEEVAAYFAHHGDAAAPELSLQLADGLVAMGVKNEALPVPADLAGAFVRQAMKAGGDTFIPLLLIALSPSGLGHGSLHRLSRLWIRVGAALQTGGALKAATTVTRPVAEPAAAAFSLQFKSLVASVFDSDHLRDEPLHPFEYLDGTDAAFVLSEPVSAHRILRFRLQATRSTVIKALADLVPESIILAAETLLAEEFVRLHTASLRHLGPDEHRGVRHNRRLLQALHHLFLSVTEDPDALRALSDIPRVFPAERGEIFRRGYAMFYRTLLEAPPNWDVSRVMSADGVKRDLLAAALDTGRPVFDRAALTFDADPPRELPAWLANRAAGDPGCAAITADLLLSLSQASLQLNDFAGVKQTILAGRTVLELCPDLDRAGPSSGFDKVEIDAAIVTDRADDALFQIAALLEPLGINGRLLREGLSALDDRGLFADGFDLDARIPMIPASALSRAISLLERWAEVLATTADEDLATGAGAFSERGMTALRSAFVLFDMAHVLGRRAFRADPLGRTFYASGHATRVHIRVILLLYRNLGLIGRGDHASASRLLHLAKRRSDSLSRTVARYPAERASLLILESIICRMTWHGDSGLQLALASILEADQQMLWSPNRPRLRMRLLFERMKICRALGKTLEPAAPDVAAVFRSWAAFDLRLLKALAHESGANLWIRVLDRAEARGQTAPALSIEPVEPVEPVEA